MPDPAFEKRRKPSADGQAVSSKENFSSLSVFAVLERGRTATGVPPITWAPKREHREIGKVFKKTKRPRKQPGRLNSLSHKCLSSFNRLSPSLLRQLDLDPNSLVLPFAQHIDTTAAGERHLKGRFPSARFECFSGEDLEIPMQFALAPYMLTMHRSIKAEPVIDDQRAHPAVAPRGRGHSPPAAPRCKHLTAEWSDRPLLFPRESSSVVHSSQCRWKNAWGAERACTFPRSCFVRRRPWTRPALVIRVASRAQP